MPVASLIRVVTAAAAARAISGSSNSVSGSMILARCDSLTFVPVVGCSAL